jgi:predicted O-methyltransferase YrrM
MAYEITNIAIEDYIAALMPERPPIFAELERRAYLHGLPLLGPTQGQFLYLLAKSTGAREALEIGTATGYAAMWLLRAVAPAGGRLTAIERQPDRYRLALEYTERAGYKDAFEIYEGEWFEVLGRLPGPYDLIFLDILRNLSNEEQAPHALELCVPRLRPGGLLIADNVLCSGLVVEEDAAPVVRGIQAFNRAMMHHPELESVIIPLRDGVAIGRKKDS